MSYSREKSLILCHASAVATAHVSHLFSSCVFSLQTLAAFDKLKFRLLSQQQMISVSLLWVLVLVHHKACKIHNGVVSQGAVRGTASDSLLVLILAGIAKPTLSLSKLTSANWNYCFKLILGRKSVLCLLPIVLEFGAKTKPNPNGRSMPRCIRIDLVRFAAVRNSPNVFPT